MSTSCATPKTSIKDLPEEILLKIFSYFTAKKIYFVLAKVCRSWQSFSCDASLWRNVVLSSKDFISDHSSSNSDFRNVALSSTDFVSNPSSSSSDSPNVQLLSSDFISNHSTSNIDNARNDRCRSFFDAVVAYAAQIKTLTIRNIPDIYIRFLFNSLPSLLSQVKHLRIYNPGVSIPPNNFCLESLPLSSHLDVDRYFNFTCDKLESIQIMCYKENFHGPGPIRSHWILNLVDVCPNVRHIEFYNCMLQQYSVASIAKKIGNRVRLFAISTNNVKTQEIVNIMGNNLGEELEDLTVHENTLACFSPRLNLSPLANFRNLKSLKLWSEFKMRWNVTSLLKSLGARGLCKLETLIVINAETDYDEILTSINDNLKYLKFLVIDAWSSVTAENLGSFLSSSSSLEVLEIRNLSNFPNLKCFETLSPQLKRIEMKGCGPIEGEKLDMLRSKHSNLNIVCSSQYYCNVHHLYD